MATNIREYLTKVDIESMAMEIMKALIKKGMDKDVHIYYNNKRMWTSANEKIPVTEEGYNPHDYFEYAAYHHILSMSFEGIFYEEINERGYPSWFEKILTKYGVYVEFGNAWNISCYPVNENMKVEYTEYKKAEEEEIIRLYLGNWENGDNEEIFQPVMQLWRGLSRRVGDVGSCVLGAGFNFKHNDKSYFMPPYSHYQGSISWETDKDKIGGILQILGCTDIQYNWGNMD